MAIDLLLAQGAAVCFILNRKYSDWERFSEVQASKILPEQQPRAKFLVTIIQEYDLNAQVLVISLFIIIRRERQKCLLNMFGKCMQLQRYIVSSKCF